MTALDEQVQTDNGHFVQTKATKTYLAYLPDATEDLSLENDRVKVETISESDVSEADKDFLHAGYVIEDSDADLDESEGEEGEE